MTISTYFLEALLLKAQCFHSGVTKSRPVAMAQSPMDAVTFSLSSQYDQNISTH